MLERGDERIALFGYYDINGTTKYQTAASMPCGRWGERRNVWFGSVRVVGGVCGCMYGCLNPNMHATNKTNDRQTRFFSS